MSRGVGAISIGAGLAGWEAAGRLGDPGLLPPFSAVLREVPELAAGGDLAVAGASFFHLGLGLAISVGLAGLTLLVVLLSPRGERLLLPYLNAGMALPAVAFVPVFILVLGFGNGAPTATVVLMSFFPMVVHAYAGRNRAGRGLVEMADSFQCPPLRQILSVRLPAALPLLMGGMTAGISRGIIGAVTGEFLVGTSGMGGLLQRFATHYRVTGLYATLLLIFGFAVAVHGVLSWTEERVVRWAAGTGSP